MTNHPADHDARAAPQIENLAARHHADYGRRILTLLDVAPCDAQRKQLAACPAFNVRAAQISPSDAVITETTPDARTICVPPDPECFVTDRHDIILALSLFTRAPAAPWSAWLSALYYNLERDGLLIFATNGRAAHRAAGRPRLHPDGFHAAHPCGADPDGARMIVTPGYVMDRLDLCPNAELVAFQSAGWRGTNDLWIVRKTVTPFARNALAERDGLTAEIAALQASRDIIRESTSWRVTAPLRALARMFTAA